MSEKLTVDDIEVPEGMLSAYMGAAGFTHDHESRPACRQRLAETLLWLAENPIVPPLEVENEVLYGNPANNIEGMCARTWAAVEWQRRMFRKPGPELPAMVKNIIADAVSQGMEPALATRCAMQAYELGKASEARA